MGAWRAVLAAPEPQGCGSGALSGDYFSCFSNVKALSCILPGKMVLGTNIFLHVFGIVQPWRGWDAAGRRKIAEIPISPTKRKYYSLTWCKRCSFVPEQHRSMERDAQVHQGQWVPGEGVKRLKMFSLSKRRDPGSVPGSNQGGEQAVISTKS